MEKTNQALKGTQDVLQDAYKWQYVERLAVETAALYGFREVRVPTFEYTEVFTGSVGESSDIVQKEMYTFQDKGGRSVTLRPEFTAGVVRAMIEHGEINGALPRKVCYAGSCFRQERPQKGRQREFHQFGVESFGPADPAADVEIIALAVAFFDVLGLEDVKLKINSIGCPECRKEYLVRLREYLFSHRAGLDGDSLNRLETNPMRILDSKVPSTIEIVAGAPKITDFLCGDCSRHFGSVLEQLDALEIVYELSPLLVRGLDYYTNTVFEFVSASIGAQDAIGGGGRYNLLVERRGGKPTPALGFAIGLERVIMLMEQTGALFPEGKKCDIYIAPIGDAASKKALELTAEFRSMGFWAETDLMNRSVKAQMKYANKIGAEYALVLGEREVEEGAASLKKMESGETVELKLGSELFEWFTQARLMSVKKELNDIFSGGDFDGFDEPDEDEDFQA